MPVVRLTPSFVRLARCIEGRKTDFFDSKQRGLLLEVRSSGGKTYYQRYSDERGRERHVKIGPADIIDLSQARLRAKTYLAEAILGGSPQAEREARRAIPSFDDFTEKRYLPYIRTYKRSWATDETMLRLHILPMVGSLCLDELQPDTVAEILRKLQAAGYASGTVNRAIVVLRYLLKLARKWRVIPETTPDPTREFKCAPDVQRQRFLSIEEIHRLRAAIEEDENRNAAAAIYLLLLTGARRNEILRAQWNQIDYSTRSIFVPMSKSGKPRNIALGEAAIKLLTSLPKNGAYIFGLPGSGKPPTSLFFPWQRIRTKAGLSNVRLHDLRHTFASVLVNRGVSLFVVQRLLGHTNPRATQRYAHLEGETLADATALFAKSVGM